MAWAGGVAALASPPGAFSAGEPSPMRPGGGEGAAEGDRPSVLDGGRAGRRSSDFQVLTTGSPGASGNAPKHLLQRPGQSLLTLRGAARKPSGSGDLPRCATFLRARAC